MSLKFRIWSCFFSSQIQREREEMERRDLRKMILDGEAKQKEMKKKQLVRSDWNCFM